MIQGVSVACLHYHTPLDIDPKDPIPEPANCTNNPRDTGFHCVQVCPDFGNHSAPSRNDNTTCFGKHVKHEIMCDIEN